MEAKLVIENYDLADGNTSYITKLEGNQKYAIQAVWADLTGTLDGVISIQQSLDGTTFATIQTLNPTGWEDLDADMDSAADSAIISDPEGFTGSWLKINVAVNNITGGTLNVYLKS